MAGEARSKFFIGRQSSLDPRTLETKASNDVASLPGDYPFVPENLDKAMELLFLSSQGDKEAIAALLAEGVDVSAADFDDRTALHVAACEGHSEVVKYLIKKGANVNARDRWGSTPLLDAKHYGNKETCMILEAAGAKLPETSKKVPMQVANPRDVPEYEVKPHELSLSAKKDNRLPEYTIAKWNGTQVAVKEIPSDLSTQPQIVSVFRDELALLQKLRHPNIVQFLGAVTQSTPMRIIVEYCAGGDLHCYLQKNGRLELPNAVRYALDIARGLNYLHEYKPEAIMHRELKPRNILRDRVGHLKVADFHLGQMLRAASEIQSDFSGQSFSDSSRYYMAPELLRGEVFDKSVDVYSFGMILYQMIEGHPPFSDKSEDELIEVVGNRNERPLFKLKEKHYPDGLKELIKACWDEKPSRRPNFTTIILALEKLKLHEKRSFWKRLLNPTKRTLSLRSLSFR